MSLQACEFLCCAFTAQTSPGQGLQLSTGMIQVTAHLQHLQLAMMRYFQGSALRHQVPS